MTLPRVVLAPRRDLPFLAGHPWVFSGSILRVEGDPGDGDEVEVMTSEGAFVARGLFNGRSQIRVRLYRWEPRPIDDAFVAGRIHEALAVRRTLSLDAPEGAARLVFSEGDGLSGLTVDRYGPYLTVQFTSLALARRMDVILDTLEAALDPRGIVLRTEKGILEEEGLELRDGPLRGDVPDGPIEITDGGLRFGVDLRVGQKTGFYLDQRENRQRAAVYATGRTVADVCCYTGGFAVALAAAGASSVRGVDASARSLEMAADNADRNGVSDRVSFERSDAFRWLEAQRDERARFGLIVLDPPRFARSRKGVPQALKAYRRLNGLALSCLEPGGILVTCSCSGRVGADDFLGAVAQAAADNGRSVRLLERGTQARDHPVSLACPESSYLKSLICMAD